MIDCTKPISTTVEFSSTPLAYTLTQKQYDMIDNNIETNIIYFHKLVQMFEASGFLDYRTLASQITILFIQARQHMINSFQTRSPVRISKHSFTFHSYQYNDFVTPNYVDVTIKYSAQSDKIIDFFIRLGNERQKVSLNILKCTQQNKFSLKLPSADLQPFQLKLSYHNLVGEMAIATINIQEVLADKLMFEQDCSFLIFSTKILFEVTLSVHVPFCSITEREHPFECYFVDSINEDIPNICSLSSSCFPAIKEAYERSAGKERTASLLLSKRLYDQLNERLREIHSLKIEHDQALALVQSEAKQKETAMREREQLCREKEKETANARELEKTNEELRKRIAELEDQVKNLQESLENTQKEAEETKQTLSSQLVLAEKDTITFSE